MKITEPPSPPQDAQLLADMKDMRRAISFAAQLLRDELGPGGLMQDESESAKYGWESDGWSRPLLFR